MTAANYSSRLHLPLPAGGDYDTRANHNELVTQAEIYIADKSTTDAHIAAAAPHSGHETPTGSAAKVSAHNADPAAHPGFTTTNALATHQTANPIDHPNGSVTDVKIQQYTLSPANVTSSGPFGLGTFLNAFADRLKAHTGSTNWWDAPAKTLQDLANHIANLSNPHQVTAAQTGAVAASSGTATNVSLAGAVFGAPGWASGQTFPSVTSQSWLQANNGVVYLDSGAHYVQWYGGGGYYIVPSGEMLLDNSWVITETNTRTLSNKTLNSPTLNSPGITSPSISGTTTSSGDAHFSAVYAASTLNAASVIIGNNQICAFGGYNGGANANAFLTPNNGDYTGQGLANQWRTYSCVDHAAEFGLRHEPVSDPLTIVRGITGYSYDHAHFSNHPDEPVRDGDGNIITTPLHGFRESEVAQLLPNIAGDSSIDYNRMLPVLWEAVKELTSRVETLEAHATTN